METSVSWRSPYGRSAEPILENLAVALRGAAKIARRNPGRAAEGADKIRQIREADVERDIGDGTFLFGQQARGATQPDANQILVRSHAQHIAKQAQKVE